MSASSSQPPVSPPNTAEEVEIPRGALADGDSVRVDTWLWAIRKMKSRSQATSAARAGHVKVNGDSAKAAQKIRVGAPQARVCYEDRTPARPKMVVPIAIRERGAGRPSKKERRELDRLRGRDSHERARLERAFTPWDREAALEE